MGTTNITSNKEDPEQHIYPDNNFKYQDLIYDLSDQTSNTPRTQQTSSQNSSTQRKHSNKQKETLANPIKRQESLLTDFDQLRTTSTRIEKLNNILNEEIKNYELQKQARSRRRNTDLSQIPKKKTKRQKTQPESVMMGIWIGITISLMIVLVVIIQINNLSIANKSQFSRDFPAWRGIAIWIFYTKQRELSLNQRKLESKMIELIRFWGIFSYFLILIESMNSIFMSF